MIYKILEKFGRMLGFNTGIEVDESKSNRAINKAVDLDYPLFRQILPYRSYDEQTGLFYNQESIGFAMEIAPLAGADETLIASLASGFKNKIEDNIEVQFTTWGHDKIGHGIDGIAATQSDQGGMFQELAKYSARYFKRAVSQGFNNKAGIPLTVRDYRCFVFISKKITTASFSIDSLKEKFKNLKNEDTSEEGSTITRFIKFKESFETELSSAGLTVFTLDKSEFIQVLRDWVNLDHQNIYPSSFSENSFNKKEEINKLIVDPSFELIQNKDHLLHTMNSKRTGKTVSNAIVNLSVQDFPHEFGLWQLPDLYSNIMRKGTSINCPFLFSVTFRMREHTAALAKASKKYRDADKQANSPTAKLFSGTEKKAAEWKKIRDDLSNGDVRLVDAFVNLTLFTKGDEAERNKQESKARGVLRVGGFDMVNTTHMQLQSYLATLPFMSSEGFFDDVKRWGRTNILTTWNLASLVPVIADFKAGRQGLIVPTFRNQLAALDLFDENMPVANYNGAVAATSGSGKSFLVQALTMQVLAHGGKVWVIDIGDSYKKFCQTVGGTYLNVSNLSLNPFTHVENFEESQEKIMQLLAIMASPDKPISEVGQAHLLDAIGRSWKETGHDTVIDDVIKHLTVIYTEKKDDIRVDDLVTLLSQYKVGTERGRVFNDKSKLNPNSDFVVLELGELDDQPKLMKSVLFAVILFIQEQMYSSDRSLRKLCVIDEAWRLMKGDNKIAASFIEKGYRTARKHLGSFVSIAQSIRDFCSLGDDYNPAAEAAWNNSSYKIIMKQDSKSFDDICRSKPDYFSEGQQKIINGFVEAKKNGFSEFMLEMDGIYSFNRLFVDPYSRIMYSSDGRESAAVDRYRNQGMELTEATERVAREKYAKEMQELDEEKAYAEAI